MGGRFYDRVETEEGVQLMAARRAGSRRYPLTDPRPHGERTL